MSDIATDLIKIADASQVVRLDGYGRGEQTDIPLGEQCRKAATEITALRAKLAEAERECVASMDTIARERTRAEAAESRATALAAENERMKAGLRSIANHDCGCICSRDAEQKARSALRDKT